MCSQIEKMVKVDLKDAKVVLFLISRVSNLKKTVIFPVKGNIKFRMCFIYVTPFYRKHFYMKLKFDDLFYFEKICFENGRPATAQYVKKISTIFIQRGLYKSLDFLNDSL